VASVPFDISADFIPDLLLNADKELQAKSGGAMLEAPEFSDIHTRSQGMKRIIAMAKHIVPRSVPVLIEGESGTGKELLARAIHRASLRRDW
jgi:transcriptional regulator with PAS, ATPase and Fis domain